eukprot:9996-Rhodomonas_salina.2
MLCSYYGVFGTDGVCDATRRRVRAGAGATVPEVSCYACAVRCLVLASRVYRATHAATRWPLLHTVPNALHLLSTVWHRGSAALQLSRCNVQHFSETTSMRIRALGPHTVFPFSSLISVCPGADRVGSLAVDAVNACASSRKDVRVALRMRDLFGDSEGSSSPDSDDD